MPVFSLKTLRNKTSDVKQLRTDAQRLSEHASRSEHDAGVKLADLKQKDETFRYYTPEQQQAVLARLVKEFKPQRFDAAGVAVYLLDRSLPGLGEMADAVEAKSRRLPSPGTLYLQRSGRHTLDLPDRTDLQLHLLDAAYRTTFNAELSGAAAPVILARYRDALDVLADTEDPEAFFSDAASLVRWVEDKHGEHWSGPTPADVPAVLALTRAIQAAQAERVPVEVDEARELIAEARNFITRAQSLYGVRPVNASHDHTGKTQSVYEAELQALAEAAA